MVDPPLDAAPVPGIAFREIAWENAGPLLPLFNGLVRHLRESPAFVGIDNEFSEVEFAALRERRHARFFVACAGDEPVGYLEVTDDGENVLTAAPDMRHICGAFLLGSFRGRGIYDALLGFVLETLGAEGVRRVGVDFETMNPTALNFWTRYFEPYTSSYARRIDALS
jgi:GNAT superfamily N-acetyltransferase